MNCCLEGVEFSPCMYCDHFLQLLLALLLFSHDIFFDIVVLFDLIRTICKDVYNFKLFLFFSSVATSIACHDTFSKIAMPGVLLGNNNENTFVCLDTF